MSVVISEGDVDDAVRVTPLRNPTDRYNRCDYGPAITTEW
jgi:hypothetical protein